MTAGPSVILHTNAPAVAMKLLRDKHPGLSVYPCDSYAGLAALIEQTNAEVVYSVRFDGTARFPRSALLVSPTVKWVSVGGSGTDHLGPWNPAKVTVTNAAGVAADMMAEYALGAMWSFSLGLRNFARHQRARTWTAGTVEPIQGKTLLLLGLGRTGQALARRAKALGLTTLGVRAHPRPTTDVDEVHGIDALPGLWRRADFIACCVPLLEATRGLIGAAAFAAMKPTAVLIDVSRGGVVEEAALLPALDGGRIKGAALDVFSTEPLPADHPLWGYENVIVTPHCSSVYEGWEEKALAMFADNLSRYRRGEKLLGVVDPMRGY
ncbi:D-2-hydroxyacid dehydrogenase [Mesorhizobium sp.]|uniref:D-2-hydroxyacid dehydrogenase n=2 Tax=Mesorhizobium sp. TaxID=1871066 RepID=UPI000FE51F6D|nr:D-2-hydroxyacid dehydrogenase [Mesorhizobium sp.]RWB35699.1 MAG: D-2-hydroxyacid dehydrogenase [Mesorhizobium sp.]RWD36525.1 MAG: D-2-hydroxyacid dehydrogenase [Mesorhizobium sp.]RWD47808.1 MAG: D-2-hydroxyacid dehydrogenase [Mesorhizobium sp.]RWD79413.1 MAG: D-2-hydroxyacid dehydrogenase [Mesorhizobium sp.]RWE97509.1 MAG: D-2-hydroxyacid dehydrogenase [Mesorhizobium sp.]